MIRRGAAASVISAAALLAGCGGGTGGDEGAVLDVYVSMPLHGSEAAAGRAAERGAKQALAAAKGRAGDFRLHAVYLDDARGGSWNVVRTAANARSAAEHVGTIAYIGELDPTATRVSLPITNQAELPQIYPGIQGSPVRSNPGGGDPERFQPSGKNTFVPLAVPAATPPVARGARAMRLLIEAIDRAGSSGADRGAVLDQLLAD